MYIGVLSDVKDREKEFLIVEKNVSLCLSLASQVVKTIRDILSAVRN